LPGLIGERLFTVLDKNKNNYLDYNEFIEGMLILFCSTFDEKVKIVFSIYDFDNDGAINKNDIVTVISCMPVSNQNFKVKSEGKITSEGGGA
jgi:Ca2+-binding EF-hand superfamily protein